MAVATWIQRVLSPCTMTGHIATAFSGVSTCWGASPLPMMSSARCSSCLRWNYGARP